MDNFRACAEAGWGCVVLSTVSAHYLGFLHGVSVALGFVFTVTGAIIGVHGVYHIIKNRLKDGSW